MVVLNLVVDWVAMLRPQRHCPQKHCPQKHIYTKMKTFYNLLSQIQLKMEGKYHQDYYTSKNSHIAHPRNCEVHMYFKNLV